MQMRRLARAVRVAGAVTLAALSACGTGLQSEEAADLILTGGRVYTLSWGEPGPEGNPAPDAPFADGVWTPDAEAVAVRDGRILAVGSTAEMLALRGPDTEVKDLAGATAVPGLVESHGHLEELGELAEEIDLVGVRTEHEMVRRVIARGSEVAQGEWIVGGGWDEGEWANELPTNARLTELLPENPAFDPIVPDLDEFTLLGRVIEVRRSLDGPLEVL